MLTPKQFKRVFLILIVSSIIYYFGVFAHIFEKSFATSFNYPYDGDIEDLVAQMRANLTPKMAPINGYNFKFKHSCIEKCRDVDSLRIVVLVKSAPLNWRQRSAIRSTWGFERRFSDVEIRTIFLIGETIDRNLEQNLEDEYSQFRDLVRANFTDSYFNNTLKTMMGLTWVVKHCSSSKFYLFVDDDYYVSMKNLLRFIRNPTNYPYHIKGALRKPHQFDLDLNDKVRFYGGFVFKSAPHRHRNSKWFVSLDEYPYDMWPPYVSAGAYVLSREAILDMYFASFYTKHFRFDDVYMGLLAYKCKIEPYNSQNFHFYKLFYNPVIYNVVVASHGYGDPEEMVKVWTEQKEKGNA